MYDLFDERAIQYIVHLPPGFVPDPDTHVFLDPQLYPLPINPRAPRSQLLYASPPT